ncbi:thioredoxin [Jeotgalibacillus soli]|uniref:Thioredoxin n=2 Tax=Jeotgalibacillus soli TaxID=889306 RepID=A0A0C2RD27_9BACL|nr:thioredoxin [Jeotgalibacillus soli]
MTTLNEWFEKGITPEEYIAQMQTHKENLEHVLKTFTLPEEESFFDALSSKKLRAIAITEDWCGDAMMNVPVLIKLAEKTGMEVRMLLRDSNLELMDQYLTNGTARSIPIFIFIDEDGQEVAKWGPRAAKVQAFVDETRASLPAKEDPAFEGSQRLVFTKMVAAFKEREDFWMAVYEELKNTLDK